jgi:TrmH family RNA methyltransferase
MITSAQNPKIKHLRLLQNQPSQRRLEKTFVLEGVRLAEEALNSGWKARLVIYTEDLSERGRSVLEGFADQGAPVELVSQAVMSTASDTQTPQGLLIALEWRTASLPPKPDFVFIADQIRDPGNLGTILRTAAAAGVQALLLPPESADAFAPKTLRAGMGAQFKLAVQQTSYEQIADYLSGLPVYLASAGEGIPYTEVDFHPPLALVIGGEARGAGAAIRQLVTSCVHIPMPGGVESLNAAVAAGILMFEIVRQRAEKPSTI